EAGAGEEFVPLLALEPFGVRLRPENDVWDASCVERELGLRDEGVLFEAAHDASELRPDRRVGVRAEVLNRDVIEEAPCSGQGDGRGGAESRDDEGLSKAFGSETGDDVDDDVLAARGRERASDQREEQREPRSGAAKASEQRQNGSLLQ